MARIDEIVSAQFRSWEERGRGWKVYPNPVELEPPFRPFTEYRLPQIEDDGRKETFLSSLFNSVRSAFVAEPEKGSVPEEKDPDPVAMERDSISELQILLPADLKIPDDHFRSFLDGLESCREPLAFELIGQHDGIRAQFAGNPSDIAKVERRLSGLFPNAAFLEVENRLEGVWEASAEYRTTVDFGLEDEFILPLATDHAVDPFIGIITAMSHLKPDEMALLQVVFEPAIRPWPASALQAITNAEGKSLFLDFGEFLKGSKEKFSCPLFGAVVRVAAAADDPDRVWEITRDLAFSLRTFSNPEGNGLIPLHNREYAFEAHESDILLRQSRRTGMILNRDELMSFVHLPSDDIKISKFKRQIERTKPAPPSSIVSGGVVLGENHHIQTQQTVALSPTERARHMHVIGASGTGKSTFLFNLIAQDIEHGEGIAVLDPHGDLIDRILGVIPKGRIDDVVLIDPSDEEYSVGFNFLSAHSDLEKNLLASDLVSVFHRLSASWGDQMGSVLRNAILAFLESSRGGTISDLRRFLIEPAFRDEFLCTVSDPDIVYYWRKGFMQLSGNKSIGPVITRLDTFLAPKPLRYMVAQEANKIDFANILDTGKILLAKLSQGQIGRENSFLLGSLFVAKFQQLAMGRQAQAVETRRPFYLYIDEFQNFITPSMAEILSGARKYKLGLVLAHQELRQLERDREVASAVLSNSYTRVVFRVGDADARALESGFSYFEARDLQNLETGQAICRIEKASNDFNLLIPREERSSDESVRRLAIEGSRRRYATPRSEIETLMRSKINPDPPKKEKRSTAPPPSEPNISEAKPSETPKPGASEKEEPPKEKQPEPAKVEPEVPEITLKPPEITPSEAQKEVPRADADISSKSSEPRNFGRGGEQHKLIVKRIQTLAQKLGYRAEPEFEVLEKTGSVDLALFRDNRQIAIEVAITTTIDHEVGNVSKCIKAGFKSVAVVAVTETKLAQLKEAVTNALGAEQVGLVAFYLPDQFCEFLPELAKKDAETAKPHDKTKASRGYKVKTSVPKLTPEELKAKEEAWLRALREGMKRKPPDDKK